MSLVLIQKWAILRGGNPKRISAIRRLALRLYDGLCKGGSRNRIQRAVLHAAAVLSDLDFAGPRENKEPVVSQLGKLSPLPGFPPESMHLTEIVVRCQRGKFHGSSDVELATLPEEHQQLIMKLAGILRLAKVLTHKGHQPVGRVEVQKEGSVIAILVEGYSEFGPLAEKTARARHLLECACRRPVLVRSVPSEAAEGVAPEFSPER